MANSVLNYIINVVKKGTGDKQTLTALQSVKSVMTGVGAAAAVATTAYVAFDKIIGESSRKTVKLSEDVRKLMSVTNQTAEATSVMIQVGDDYKVTAEQMLVASKNLAKQGYGMSIDTLAKLSDKYKSLGTAEEKQLFLTKNLGKAGSDYIEMLEAGGDTLRANATQVNKNLILTQKQVQAARDYEIAQDDLNDTVESYQILIGTRAIPVITKMIKGLNEQADGLSRNEIIARRTAEANSVLVTSLEEAAAAETEYWRRQKQLADLADREATDAILKFADAVGEGTDATKQWLLANYQQNLAMRGIPAEEAARKILEYEHALGLTSKAEYDAKVKAQELKGAIDALQNKDIFVTTYMITQMGQAGDPIQQAQAFAATQTSGGGGGAGWIYKGGNGYGKGPDGKVRHYYNPQTGAYRAVGGYPTGWTVVGEHGKELISPDGYVHSNAESRRLVQAGVTPFRSLATGGTLAVGDFGQVNIGSPESRSGTQRNPNLTSVRSIAGGAASLILSSRSSSSASSAPAVAATIQAATVQVQSAQAVQQAAGAIAESNVQTQNATKIQTEVSKVQQDALLAEVRGLRNDIKNIIPKAIADGYQKVVGA